jgi:outer membrane protein, multidrug efflux system
MNRLEIKSWTTRRWTLPVTRRGATEAAQAASLPCRRLPVGATANAKPAGEGESSQSTHDSFPLTPTLSLGEREKHRSRSLLTQISNSSAATPRSPEGSADESHASASSNVRALTLPLPKGEGRGEGEGGDRIAGPVRQHAYAAKHKRPLRKYTMSAASAMVAVLLAGCKAVGPDYQKPSAATPAAYKGAEFANAWKEGSPSDHLPKGAWWEIFGDTTLNELERRATESNQNLKAALLRIEQARATARVRRGELQPTLGVNPRFRRERFSPTQQPNFGELTANTFTLPLDFSYEVDLWGKVRRGFEAARAEAGGSVAAYHNLLLTLQADVAQNYFQLRAIDAEMAAVRSTIELRREELQLVRSRFEGGISSELDVARAQTELAVAEAEHAALARIRSELENAIAVLMGATASEFRIATDDSAASHWRPAPPAVPAGLPSDLLERRPDVAEAERQLAASNARIGVAISQYFPSLHLTGSGGQLSGSVDQLFNWDSRVWTIGPSLQIPLFSGGRNRANLDRARAAYEEAVARYRQQVLVAFRDVENSLAGIHHLADQSAAQDRAAAGARRAAELAAERYRAGIVGYLEVVDANRAALITQRGQAQLAGQRLIAAVNLIKALGGGWSAGENSDQMTATKPISRTAND